MTEQWRPIAGHPGHEVSSLGRVRGIQRRARTVSRHGVEASRRVPPRMIRPCQRADGRVVVVLYRDGQCYEINLRTLVLETFAGPRPRGCHPKHRDGDPRDCRLSNLRWAKRDWITRPKTKHHNEKTTA